MPLNVSCPRPPLRQFSSWGVARSFCPLAWLWVAPLLVGGPVRPGRFGAWGVGGGGWFAAPPLGAWLGPGR